MNENLVVEFEMQNAAPIPPGPGGDVSSVDGLLPDPDTKDVKTRDQMSTAELMELKEAGGIVPGMDYRTDDDLLVMHRDLPGRDEEDAHPMQAITGLLDELALRGRTKAVDGVTPDEVGNIDTSGVNVRYAQAKNSEPQDLFLDTNAESFMPSNRSSLNPYVSFADLQTSSRYNDDVVIHVTEGSDINQAITLANIQHLALQADSGTDVINSIISGNLTIVGSGNIRISGFIVTGNVVINGTANIEFKDCFVQGSVSGYTVGKMSFYHCTFFFNVTLQGTAAFSAYFENCYGRNTATIVNQNPNCSLAISDSSKLYTNVPQGNFRAKNTMFYGLVTTTTGIVDIQGGSCVQPGANQVYNTISISSACSGLNIGNFSFDEIGSTLGGAWISGGLSSLQVRTRGTYTNITPRHNLSDGTDPNRAADLLEDTITGVDDAIGLLITAAAGVKAVGVVGANLVFYADAAKTLPIGAIPLSDLSNYSDSDSISIIDGVITVNLQSGPLFAALQSKVEDPFYVHTDNNLTDERANIIDSIVPITSVQQANGLSYEGGVLSMANILERIFTVGAIYETTDADLNTPASIATHFGFGTWEAFGAGRALVAIDTGQTEFNAIGKTGGNKSITLATANLPSHTHSIPALTTGNQSANHSHTINHSHSFNGYRSFASGSSGQVKSREYISGDPTDYGGNAYSGSSGNNSANHTHSTSATNTGSTGGAEAVNNLQPFIVVYRYRRIA
ncbi:hypothetical protein LQZ19_08820 [Treponema primitia]|uniref:phage baseplate protein n=1 Tax=Treponema primitia TaxID=88058 RepID=UPI0039806157